jgi:hypothetical protein
MDKSDLEEMGITEKKIYSSEFNELLRAKTREEFVNVVNGSLKIKSVLGCSNFHKDDFRKNYNRAYYKLKD